MIFGSYGVFLYDVTRRRNIHHIRFFSGKSKNNVICSKLVENDNWMYKSTNSAKLFKKTGKKKLKYSVKKKRNLGQPACQNAVAMAVSNDVEKELTHQNFSKGWRKSYWKFQHHRLNRIPLFKSPRVENECREDGKEQKGEKYWSTAKMI